MQTSITLLLFSHYKSLHTRSSQSAVTSLRNSPQQWLFLYNAFTIRFLATDFNTGTITITLQISLYYNTYKVFKSHVKSSFHRLTFKSQPTWTQSFWCLNSSIQLLCFRAHILAGWRSKLDWQQTIFVVLYNLPARTIQKTSIAQCLASLCLVMDVSAVLLWLHTSGVQAPCHSILKSLHICQSWLPFDSIQFYIGVTYAVKTAYLNILLVRNRRYFWVSEIAVRICQEVFHNLLDELTR
jgi:hypothetical protein